MRAPKPNAKRGGRYLVLLELDPEDFKVLEGLVKRYSEVTSESNRAFVLRQLIRHAPLNGKSLPKIKLVP